MSTKPGHARIKITDRFPRLHQPMPGCLPHNEQYQDGVQHLGPLDLGRRPYLGHALAFLKRHCFF